MSFYAFCYLNTCALFSPLAHRHFLTLQTLITSIAYHTFAAINLYTRARRQGDDRFMAAVNRHRLQCNAAQPNIYEHQSKHLLKPISYGLSFRFDFFNYMVRKLHFGLQILYVRIQFAFFRRSFAVGIISCQINFVWKTWAGVGVQNCIKLDGNKNNSAVATLDVANEA